MKIRAILMFILVAILFLGCASSYKLDVKESVDLNNYDLYTFRLCERINTVGKDRFLLCDDSCAENDIQANDKIQVVEELYLLLSRVNREDAIYISSRSDKYIHEDRGAFNDDSYKEYAFTNDLERLYYGKMNSNRSITFTNIKDTLIFKLNESKSTTCSVVIDSIQHISREKIVLSNKRLPLNDVFSVPIRFNKTDRIIANRPRKRDSLFDPVRSIELKGRRIFFTGNNTVESKSQRRWLKYHPEFKQID